MNGQTQIISDLINTVMMRSLLSKNIALWNQLLSCLDVIEDTELAIAAYLDNEYGKSNGANYLALYGLLQALFLQQDAVKYLCESLGMSDPLKNNPRLKKIKDIRNDTTGHPTKRNRNKQTSYHFIARHSIKSERLKLMSVSGNETPKFTDVLIYGLITEQKTCLSEILTTVVSELKQKETAHKEKFKMEKLVSFFPTNLGYCFQKIIGGTTLDPRDVPLGAGGLLAITKAIHDFKEALAQRGVDYASVEDVCKLLEYPLAELEVFFQNAQNGKDLNINEKTAYIFAFFVEKHFFDQLIPLAKEIDEDYSS